MANDLVELKVNEEEISFITMALGLFIETLDGKIERRHKRGERGQDFDMDEMFFLMDKKFGAMNLWRKTLITAGVDPDLLAEHIEQATDEEGI